MAGSTPLCHISASRHALGSKGAAAASWKQISVAATSSWGSGTSKRMFKCVVDVFGPALIAAGSWRVCDSYQILNGPKGSGVRVD